MENAEKSLTDMVREVMCTMLSSCPDPIHGMLLLMSIRNVVTDILDEMTKDEDVSENRFDGVVFLSRYTPGLENAFQIRLDEGDVVTWRSKDGSEVKITIDSDLMMNGTHIGYEAIFEDTGERAFACSDQIVDWEGKVNENI